MAAMPKTSIEVLAMVRGEGSAVGPSEMPFHRSSSLLPDYSQTRSNAACNFVKFIASLIWQYQRSARRTYGLSCQRKFRTCERSVSANVRVVKGAPDVSPTQAVYQIKYYTIRARVGYAAGSVTQ